SPLLPDPASLLPGPDARAVGAPQRGRRRCGLRGRQHPPRGQTVPPRAARATPDRSAAPPTRSRTRMALPLLLLVLLAGAAPAQVPGAAALSGTAYDHLVGAPLAGVRVALSGASSRTATTDEHGGFHLAELPPGEYRVSVMDRRLELLSAFPPVVRIELPRGGHRQLQLGTPSRETLLDALCGSREAALVYGFVL